MSETLQTCFACGLLFDPTAYGHPKQRCRLCELIGIPTTEAKFVGTWWHIKPKYTPHQSLFKRLVGA